MDKGFFLRWMTDLLNWLGLNSADGGFKSLAAALVVIVCCGLVWWIVRFVLLRTVRLKEKISAPYIHLIFDAKNLKKIALTVSVLLFYILLPLAFDPATDLGRIVKKGLDIVLVWMFFFHCS